MILGVLYEKVIRGKGSIGHYSLLITELFEEGNLFLGCYLVSVCCLT